MEVYRLTGFRESADMMIINDNANLKVSVFLLFTRKGGEDVVVNREWQRREVGERGLPREGMGIGERVEK